MVDYTVGGYDKSKVFCTVGAVYGQDEVGDSLVPYYKSFIISLKKNDEFGIYMPKGVDKKSANTLSLVDEHGLPVDIFVTLKENTKEIYVDLSKVLFKSSDYPEFFIEVQTPSIPSYEIEFKFKKKEGSVFVFNFRMNQERKEKKYFFWGELLKN